MNHVRRIFTAFSAGILALTLTPLLGACSSTAAASPFPEASAPTIPQFSDEEALGAAMTVYRHLDRIMLTTRSVDSRRFAMFSSVATPERMALLKTDGSFIDHEVFVLGRATYFNTTLVDQTRTDDTLRIQIALCRDVSSLRFIDREGKPDSTWQVREYVPHSAVFVWDPEKSRLLVDQAGPWHDESICDRGDSADS